MKARYWPCFSVKRCGPLRRAVPDLGLIVRFDWSPPRGDQNECTVPGRTEPSRTRSAEGLAEWGQACGAQVEAGADPAGGRCESLRRGDRPQRGVGGSTVCRTKRRFVLGNLEAALS